LDKERMVIQDTRIFHKFGSSEIIFEVSHAEETFENLEKVNIGFID
jgi:Cdc6-like AAA superfamily ATPase